MTAGVKANVDGSAAIQVGGSDAINISTGLTVGIGTSSPGAKLDVRGSSTFLVNATSPTAWVSVDSALTTGSVYTQWNTSTNEGIFGSYTNHPIYFVTNNNRRLTIDTSGNVGIGTSSPSYRLEVKGPSATAGQLSIHDGTGDTTVSGNNAASLLFQARDTSVRTIAEIDAVNTTTNGTGGAMVFQTRISDTLAERARIDSSGNLLINTTSTIGGSAGVLQLKGQASSTAAVLQIGTDGQNGFSFRNSATTQVGTIVVNTASTAYNTSSDYRLKENVQPMQGALAKVAALKPVTYTWKANGEASQGFIAHELQEVVPECVSGEKDATETYLDEDGNEQTRPMYQGIDTSFLVATLTAALQEAHSLIKDLQSRVDALEAK